MIKDVEIECAVVKYGVRLLFFSFSFSWCMRRVEGASCVA